MVTNQLFKLSELYKTHFWGISVSKMINFVHKIPK